MEKEISNIILRGTKRLLFTNFAGKKTQYNRAGDRNFCVPIEKDLAAQLQADGWNIKWPKPEKIQEAKDNGYDEPLPYIPVSMRFDIFPPVLYLHDDNNKKYWMIEESDVYKFDNEPGTRGFRVKSWDLVIRPYQYEFQDRSGNTVTGIKAYLKSLHAHLADPEDELAGDYENYVNGDVEPMPFE